VALENTGVKKLEIRASEPQRSARIKGQLITKRMQNPEYRSQGSQRSEIGASEVKKPEIRDRSLRGQEARDQRSEPQRSEVKNAGVRIKNEKTTGKGVPRFGRLAKGSWILDAGCWILDSGF